MEKTFRADLHTHSTCSDGSLTPPELIRSALQAGLSALSITDHDCCDAYRSAISAARTEGLELISGVEFSAECNGENVHILGYSFAWDDSNITALSERHRIRRRSRNDAILAKLKQRGMLISAEELETCASGIAGRPHIAQIMVKKGYVADIKSAFKRYLAEGRPCYESGKAFSAEETIEVIHRANGFAIIAHPHIIRSPNQLRALLKLPFDGIEGYYSQFPPEANQRWINMAIKKKWLLTGGSDFHGSCKPTVTLGSAWVGKEEYRPLRERFEHNNSA